MFRRILTPEFRFTEFRVNGIQGQIENGIPGGKFGNFAGSKYNYTETSCD